MDQWTNGPMDQWTLDIQSDIESDWRNSCDPMKRKHYVERPECSNSFGANKVLSHIKVTYTAHVTNVTHIKFSASVMFQSLLWLY